MISHVTIGVSETARTKEFFDGVFAPLGFELRTFAREWVSWRKPGEDFPFLTALLPLDDAAPSAGNGSMVALLAPDRPAVDAAYAAAMAGGGACEGPPGLRPQYHENYYGTYFRDIDGNKLCIVCHEAPE